MTPQASAICWRTLIICNNSNCEISLSAISCRRCAPCDCSHTCAQWLRTVCLKLVGAPFTSKPPKDEFPDVDVVPEERPNFVNRLANGLPSIVSSRQGRCPRSLGTLHKAKMPFKFAYDYHIQVIQRNSTLLLFSL